MSEYVFEEVRGQHFADQDVSVCGKHFIDCHFVRCRMVFDASAPFQITGNGSATDVIWYFTGSASATVEIMRMLYFAGQKHTVESMINYIRGVEPGRFAD